MNYLLDDSGGAAISDEVFDSGRLAPAYFNQPCPGGYVGKKSLKKIKGCACVKVE